MSWEGSSISAHAVSLEMEDGFCKLDTDSIANDFDTSSCDTAETVKVSLR